MVAEELKIRKALVAVQANKILACVFYEQKESSVYIDRLAVLPEYRQQGIATKLMQEIELQAKALGQTR